MAAKAKKIKDLKTGFNKKKNKIGINVWRFFFNGIGSVSGSEKMFFIEFEILNPILAQSEAVLSFKPKVKISADDLQYALAGTQSASSLETEEKNLPSYCVVRCGRLGDSPKQICSYFSFKDINFNARPFEINIGKNFFSEEHLLGNIKVSKEEHSKHPEYLCDFGSASWELSYNADCEIEKGEDSKTFRWFSSGLRTAFAGKIIFDGEEYTVDSRKSLGYSERYFGKSLVEPWFHISCTNLTSVISGKILFDSAFSIQGIFDEKIAFIGKFEDSLIEFPTAATKKHVSCVWDCVQMPENENPDENLLHWTVSISSKKWVVDVDVYCKIKEIFNRCLELPDASRHVLNMLQGATGSGEIKLYKKTGPNLEQIEHANLTKVVCEFGHFEQSEF